jgi:hypothetical protein
MEQREQSPATILRRLVNGYQISQAIHVAAVLGIADLLKDGPRTCDELAASTDTHAPTLYRLMRALASVGVFHEAPEGTFALTPISDCLRADATEPLGGWAAFIGQPHQWEVWGHLIDSVRTGGNAFRLVHGIGSWEYRVQHPELGATFDRAMTTNSRRHAAQIVDSYDLSRFGVLVDIGGGQGALLATILAGHPHMRGVLFDQPQVIAHAADLLQAAGVTARCRVVGGDFFVDVPGGADAYLLKFIIHDWDDERAIAILRTCRRAIPPAGTLLVIERNLGGPNENWDPKFMDLMMLVSPGGQERTRDEYAALFSQAGFRLTASFPAGDLAIFEGVPVSAQ